MSDGTRLATDVYLPAGRGPFPVVLTRLPYDKCGRDCFVPWVAAYMVERGYAFVAQDTRGKGRSEGETVAFVNELADGYDTLEWLAGQRWCDGAIGMWGESYFGFTQWAAAASGHRALRAIVPRNTTADVAGDWLYRQGVRRLAFPLTWAADTWMDRRMYGIVPSDIDWSLGTERAFLGCVHPGRRCPSSELWRANPPGAGFWERVPFGPGRVASGLRIPALHVGGWFDIFQRGQLRDWRAALAGATAPQLLVMEATDHAHCHWSVEPPGQIDLHSVPDAEIEAFMPEYLDTTLAFLDVVLRGRGELGATVRWRGAGSEWQAEETWPPAKAEPLSLHLVAAERARSDLEGGGLSLRPETTAKTVCWDHDPDRPVPSLYADELQAMAAPPDDHLLTGRPDVLRFTSEPFSSGLRLAGPVTAHLATPAPAVATPTFAKLVAIAPDGRTRRLRDGAAVHGPAADSERVAIELGDLGHWLAPGHRLRLEVSASSFPQFAIEDGGPVKRSLLAGGPRGSTLELTILQANRSPTRRSDDHD